MRKFITILLFFMLPLLSEAQSNWYQVSGKDLSFSSVIASFNATTVNGSPYQVLLNGVTYTFNSGQNVMFAYPNNVGLLTISFLSYSNIRSINLISNLTFDLDSLSKLSNLTSFGSAAACTNTGRIGNNLPTTLINFSSSSSSATVKGTIDSLPPNMTTFTFTGGPVMNGTIDSLPATMTSITLTTSGGIITGSFDSLKSKNFTSIQFYGNSSIGGNVNALKTIQTLVFNGSPSCHVNLDSLPNSLSVVEFIGNVLSFTGGINNMPNSMYLFEMNTNNGTLDSVSLNSLPPYINYFILNSPVRAVSYTPGRSWISNMRAFNVSTLPLTSTEVDNLLIDLSNTTWNINSTLTITGNAAPRTSVSNAAVSKLQSMGVTVTTN